MNKKLTKEQRIIVDHIDGHALVKAVPGSGKTTTLVKRVQKLISTGVHQHSILILMYNRAAQKSFAEKLKKTLPYGALIPEVRTFHSLGLKIVAKAESNKLLPKKTLITPDQLNYKDIVKESYRQGFDWDESYIDTSKIEELELFITNCRSEAVTPNDLDSDPTFSDISSSNKKAYRHYCTLLDDKRLRTFDDILIDAVSVLRTHPELGNQFQHIIVDEYQDVNFIQHELIRLLAASQANVMAVGDINQCIYEWRGSRPDFISGIFEKHFHKTTIYHLSCTFRYGHQISMIANSVIGKNSNKLNKLCISHPNTPKSRVFLQQGKPLIEVLQAFRSEESEKSSDTCSVIARSKAHLMEAELALRILGIPYNHKSGDNPLHSRHEIGLLIICFSIAIHGGITHLTAEPFFRGVLFGFLHQGNFRWKKGQSTSVLQQLISNPELLWDLLKEQMQSSSTHQKNRFGALSEIKGKFTSDVNASIVFDTLVSMELFRGIDDGALVRQEANDRTRGILRIGELLKHSKILSGDFLDILLQDAPSPGNGLTIDLCTMHGSKGLEWDSVIIIGLNESEYPGAQPGTNFPIVLRDSSLSEQQAELEEERRLFYVAITRAKTNLHLLVPDDKSLQHWLKQGWSSTPKKEVTATRFVFECNIIQSAIFSLALYQDNVTTTDPSQSKLFTWYFREFKRLIM